MANQRNMADVDSVSSGAGLHTLPDNTSLLLGAPDLHSASRKLGVYCILGQGDGLFESATLLHS